MKACWICGTSLEVSLEVSSRMPSEQREFMQDFINEELPVNTCVECYVRLLSLVMYMFDQGHLKLSGKKVKK